MLGRNYPNNKRNWKIAEALLIKNLKLSINVQEKSVALVNTMKRRTLRRILKHLAFSWNFVWMCLFIPCYFIKIISLLEAGQTPLLKYMIRNFLIYVNKNQRSLNEEEKQSKNIRHNFSSYSLTKEEVEALSYGIDQHIPNYNDRNNINTEFELLFQNI